MINESLVFEILRDDYISEKARESIKYAYEQNDEQALSQELEKMFIVELTKYYLSKMDMP